MSSFKMYEKAYVSMKSNCFHNAHTSLYNSGIKFFNEFTYIYSDTFYPQTSLNIIFNSKEQKTCCIDSLPDYKTNNSKYLTNYF
jgi:choline kinase